MVNIVGRSEKERNLFTKYDTLVEITEKADLRVVPNGRPIDFAVENYFTGIVVYVNSNLVNVSREDDLNMAVKLAGLYENATGEEFTVKKDYD